MISFGGDAYLFIKDLRAVTGHSSSGRPRQRQSSSTRLQPRRKEGYIGSARGVLERFYVSATAKNKSALEVAIIQEVINHLLYSAKNCNSVKYHANGRFKCDYCMHATGDVRTRIVSSSTSVKHKAKQCATVELVTFLMLIVEPNYRTSMSRTAML